MLEKILESFHHTSTLDTTCIDEMSAELKRLCQVNGIGFHLNSIFVPYQAQSLSFTRPKEGKKVKTKTIDETIIKYVVGRLSLPSFYASPLIMCFIFEWVSHFKGNDVLEKLSLTYKEVLKIFKGIATVKLIRNISNVVATLMNEYSDICVLKVAVENEMSKWMAHGTIINGKFNIYSNSKLLEHSTKVPGKTMHIHRNEEKFLVKKILNIETEIQDPVQAYKKQTEDINRAFEVPQTKALQDAKDLDLFATELLNNPLRIKEKTLEIQTKQKRK